MTAWRWPVLLSLLCPVAERAVFAAAAPSPPPELRADARRMETRILMLGMFGANPEGGVSRVAYTAADLAGRAYVTSLMREAGLEVRVDAAGNILGRRAGREPGLPAILFGSHIDSVPEGGNYDGDVGSHRRHRGGRSSLAEQRHRHPPSAGARHLRRTRRAASSAAARMIGELTPEALATAEPERQDHPRRHPRSSAAIRHASPTARRAEGLRRRLPGAAHRAGRHARRGRASTSAWSRASSASTSGT